MVIISANLSNPITANIDLSGVTAEQMGKAHKVLASAGNFYLVENSEGRLSDAGEIEEYKVTFDKGIQCSCKAGQNGFANCKNYCWHVRAALACEREEQQAMAEIAIAQATEIIKEAQAPKPEEQQEPTLEQLQAVAKDILVDGKPADIATVYRVMTAKPKPAGKGKGFSSKPFSLLR